jgi:fructose-1,6-bisphosphatase/inositol monophosphatase family enzyme
MGSDVFTMADIHIQNTVKFNLREIYPRATIIGEEDEIGDFDTGDPYVFPD